MTETQRKIRLKLLKTGNPVSAAAAGIPVIALTANAFEEDVQRSLQAGLDAHLSKPVEPETLFGTLEELISKRQTPET
ncbi:MAG: response regulator [Clostridiales bacterium]|nr:response regulator [Clostridiales bacterium]